MLPRWPGRPQQRGRRSRAARRRRARLGSILFGGGTAVARGWLDRAARATLRRQPDFSGTDLVELARRFDQLDGDAVAIPAKYTEAVAIRR